MEDALSAKKKIKEILSDVSGIKGIGITWDDDGQLCVRVNVYETIKLENRKKIPFKINEIKVKIEEIGDIHLE
jgi:uncharacterized alkaline shock family protein YloU